MASDPTYKYVKGVGWVPEPEAPSRTLEGFKFSLTTPINYRSWRQFFTSRLDQSEVDRICEEAVEYRRDYDRRITLVGRPRRGPHTDMRVYLSVTNQFSNHEMQYARRQVAQEILRLEREGEIHQVTLEGTV